MQTFLPYPNFVQSVRCLDRQRLGKQRVEVLQILNTLTGKRQGWRNHPAVRMWEGHLLALAQYGLDCCTEWLRRGHKDACYDKIDQYRRDAELTPWSVLPAWFGDADFHAAHRAVLLAKLPGWYSQFGWQEAPAVKIDGRWPYVWPVPHIKTSGSKNSLPKSTNVI